MSISFHTGRSICFRDKDGNKQHFSGADKGVQVTADSNSVTLFHPNIYWRQSWIDSDDAHNRVAFPIFRHRDVLEQASRTLQMPTTDIDWAAVRAVENKNWGRVRTLDLNHPWGGFWGELIADRFGSNQLSFEISSEIKKPNTTFTRPHVLNFVDQLIEENQIANFVNITVLLCSVVPYMREADGINIIHRGIAKILGEGIGLGSWELGPTSYERIMSIFPKGVPLQAPIAKTIEIHAEKAAQDGLARVLSSIFKPLAERRIIPHGLEAKVSTAASTLAEPARGHVQFVGRHYGLSQLAA